MHPIQLENLAKNYYRCVDNHPKLTEMAKWILGHKSYSK